jgi:predicted dehydrogenase
MKSIILFGTGNLGKRYLQAVLSAPGDYRCFCYDVNSASTDTVDEFLQKNRVPPEKLTKRYSLEDILNDIDRQSLVILATTAGARVELVSRITKYVPEAIIIEKPVSQTAEEYAAIAELCRFSGIMAYTHYTLRFQPFSRELKEMVDQAESFEMTSILPAMGIACVSIHYIDLFLWLFGIRQPALAGFSYSGTYEQKRPGFYDIYGELIIKSERNGMGRFINSRTNGIRAIEIMLENKFITVYEDQRTLTIINKNDTGTAEVRHIEYLFASNYMTRIIINFLDGSINLSGELVTLDEAFNSHKLVFDYMEITGNKYLNIT